MNLLNLLIGVVLGAVLTGGVAYGWWRTNGSPNKQAAEAQLQSELNQKRHETEKELDGLLQKARNDAKKLVDQGERESEQKRAEIAREQGRIEGVKANLENQARTMEKREQKLSKRQSAIDRRETLMNQFESEHLAKLEEVAGMSSEEARLVMLGRAEQEAKQDMARVMREVEDRAKESAEMLARKHIATAMQRIANEHVAETTTASVEIPNEEMKGRIIGRAGRNIRAFEQAAGVDVVVDDTPELVIISTFDPVRREVARRALEKLIVDGRIHPARIEKMIKDIQRDVDKVIMEAGEEAAYKANVAGVHKEVLRMLGRLKFRTSYGQNQLHHSIEVAQLAGILAAEIGANVEQAKMGGLLHDIGKAMDHNTEGTHAMIGADFLKRFRVPDIVVNAVASHHHEVDQESVEAVIVETADAISGARPGARRESLENYIKRIRTLEEIATAHPGVENAYALQAGRELRVLVRPEQVDDLSAIRLAKEIAKTIENSMQYPGQIQVTIIRETRASEIAK